MLVQQSGDIIKELQFDDRLTRNNSNISLWQFKEFYDAATLGVEIIWPYETYNTTTDTPIAEMQYEKLSKELFSITFNAHISVKEQCSLFLFPHHSAFINLTKKRSNSPWPIPQTIEFDWWPGKLRIIFVNRNCIFEKNKPIAQGIVLPRRDYTVVNMKQSEIHNRENAMRFIETNRDKYITRRIDNDEFEKQDNLYERLSYLHKTNELPNEIKKINKEQNIRLIWK